MVIAFFICWAPFHTQRITAFVSRLLDKANQNLVSETATKFQEILFFTSGNINLLQISLLIFLFKGVLYYLSATVNPLLYNIMSKRYRNSFKRILCRCRSLSWRRSHPNMYHDRRSPHLTPSPYTRNPYHRAVSSNRSLNQYRDHLLTFSMSKYKFVIGSRTFARENSNRNASLHRRTSFHYHLAFLEKKEREQEKEKMKLQIQQTKFSFNLIQQQKKRRPKFIFTSNFPPSTPPNSSVHDSKNITQIPTKF